MFRINTPAAGGVKIGHFLLCTFFCVQHCITDVPMFINGSHCVDSDATLSVGRNQQAVFVSYHAAMR
jgi:hypothetical protein